MPVTDVSPGAGPAAPAASGTPSGGGAGIGWGDFATQALQYLMRLYGMSEAQAAATLQAHPEVAQALTNATPNPVGVGYQQYGIAPPSSPGAPKGGNVGMFSAPGPTFAPAVGPAASMGYPALQTPPAAPVTQPARPVTPTPATAYSSTPAVNPATTGGQNPNGVTANPWGTFQYNVPGSPGSINTGTGPSRAPIYTARQFGGAPAPQVAGPLAQGGPSQTGLVLAPGQGARAGQTVPVPTPPVKPAGVTNQQVANAIRQPNWLQTLMGTG